MMFSQILKSCLAMSIVLMTLSAVSAGCDPRDWKADPGDCSTYWICLGNVDYKFVCPSGYVVDLKQRMCVPDGSPSDTCTTKPKPTDHVDECKDGEMKAHENTCEKFYQCQLGEDGRRSMTPGECPYPLLFDGTAQKCIHYEIAQCGSRHVPVDACEYEANSCRTSHCVPCHVRFPSCAGLSDGMNAWTGREWSPYYVICHLQRVLYQGECKQDKMTQVFHPDQKMCIEYKDNLISL